MKILVIGSGGREHAMAWKLAASSKVTAVYVAPGNAGTATEPKLTNIHLDPLDTDALVAFVKDNEVDLTVVGPEAPLANGIVDDFRHANLAIVGPTQACAELESSKAFAKEFMFSYGIPTATSATFSNLEKAKAHLEKVDLPIVIKADGLAAGKGVIIAHTLNQATEALENMLSHDAFGSAGHRVVIETFLEGIEASYMILTDGKTIIPLASSQDHKARDEGDKGPNTGGMGAFSPAPIVTPELEQTILKTVIQPVIKGFQAQGKSYTGFLYAGLMISPNGDIKVLEFNCRLGDPETQPILMRLQSDFADLCLQAATGKLDSANVSWDPRPAIGVVLAADGYPGSYAKGERIQLPKADLVDQKIFHAGTRLDDNQQYVSHGGRVLTAVALADTFKAAQTAAYELVSQIDWPGAYYRKDIGYRAIAWEQQNSLN